MRYSREPVAASFSLWTKIVDRVNVWLHTIYFLLHFWMIRIENGRGVHPCFPIPIDPIAHRGYVATANLLLVRLVLQFSPREQYRTLHMAGIPFHEFANVDKYCLLLFYSLFNSLERILGVFKTIAAICGRELMECRQHNESSNHNDSNHSQLLESNALSISCCTSAP